MIHAWINFKSQLDPELTYLENFQEFLITLSSTLTNPR